MRDDGDRLVTDREAANALRRARRLRERGTSWREIAERMGWTMSEARTRLDPRYREKAWAAEALGIPEEILWPDQSASLQGRRPSAHTESSIVGKTPTS